MRQPPSTDPAARPAAIRLAGVTVRRSERTILGPLDLVVRRGERWLVLGPNGSGKTTLMQVVSTYLWPTEGEVEVLGSRIGEIDARELRRRIGYAGGGLEPAFDPDLPAVDVVMTARKAALGPWWHTWDDADRVRARELLDRFGVGARGRQAFGLLSTGERRRVQLARAMMPEPELLILDEPTAGLDLGAREELLADLAALAEDPSLAAILIVLHHVEEIPVGFGRTLLLHGGRVVAAGSTPEVVASGPLSSAFGVAVRVDSADGRYWARLEGRRGATADVVDGAADDES